MNLATASMPEKALIGYLASQLLRRFGFPASTKSTGAKRDWRQIYEEVRQVAPRGRIKKTTADVIEEMRRQYHVRQKREAERNVGIDPCSEYVRKNKYLRMSLLMSRLRNESALAHCSDFVRANGHLHVFYGGGALSSSGGKLVTRHSDGTWTETTVPARHMKLHSALMELAGYVIPRESFLAGAAVSFDLCRAVFVVTHSDGRCEEIPFNEGPVEVCGE